MFVNGQKVVCVNDTFQDWVFALYNQLPIKGNVYTIRSSSVSRTDPKDTGMNSLEVSVLLEEIKNPIDPHFKGGKQELAFKQDRFRALTKTKTEKKEYARN